MLPYYSIVADVRSAMSAGVWGGGGRQHSEHQPANEAFRFFGVLDQCEICKNFVPLQPKSSWLFLNVCRKLHEPKFNIFKLNLLLPLLLVCLQLGWRWWDCGKYVSSHSNMLLWCKMLISAAHMNNVHFFSSAQIFWVCHCHRCDCYYSGIELLSTQRDDAIALAYEAQKKNKKMTLSLFGICIETKFSHLSFLLWLEFGEYGRWY